MWSGDFMLVVLPWIVALLLLLWLVRVFQEYPKWVMVPSVAIVILVMFYVVISMDSSKRRLTLDAKCKEGIVRYEESTGVVLERVPTRWMSDCIAKFPDGTLLEVEFND